MGYLDHEPLHVLQEVVEKGDSSTLRGKTRLSSITVKFQGRGARAARGPREGETPLGQLRQL